MPFERIIGSHLPYGEDEPAILVVEVNWSREAEYVSVATRCVRADDGTDHMPPLEPIEVLPTVFHTEGIGAGNSGVNPPPLGSTYSDAVVEQFSEALLSAPVRGGFHVDLDRRGINALIRQLRRARDSAFGADA